MSARIKDRIRIIPRNLISDTRGWFLKVINGTEECLPAHTGEIYVTLSMPGQVRGNHYHLSTNEWFTVVQGVAEIRLSDVQTGEHIDLVLKASEPTTLYVPAGIAHAFQCCYAAGEPMLMVTYADRLYESTDSLPVCLI